MIAISRNWVFIVVIFLVEGPLQSIIASTGFSTETPAVKHHPALSRAWLPFFGRR
jgi:hypothetical protein